MRFAQKGQYGLEMAILVAVIAAALGFMQLYVQKCKQGHLREAAEMIGEPSAPEGSSTLTIETTIPYEYIWGKGKHLYRQTETTTTSNRSG